MIVYILNIPLIYGVQTKNARETCVPRAKSVYQLRIYYGSHTKLGSQSPLMELEAIVSVRVQLKTPFEL